MNVLKTIFVVAALAVSGAAVASPAWTYVDGGLFIGDSGFKDAETQGLVFGGSFGFANMWHVQLDLAAGEVGGGKGEDCGQQCVDGEDLWAYAVRGGLHPSLTDNTDFVLDLGYSNLELKKATEKNETSTIDIRTGVRSDVGPVELRAFISLGFFDGEASIEEGREITYTVGTQYNFTRALALGADATVSDSDDVIDIYFRWSFGG